ncbi:hypothetical protein MAR_022844, partial [Mya arenaria]
MALSILYWSRYVDGHVKLTRKSEAAVESGRVLRFSIDELRVIQANVQATMRDTSYSVQVNKHHFVYYTLLYTLHWILLEEPKPPQLPLPVIEDVLVSEGYFSSEDPRTYFRRSLVLSQEKITQIAFMTTGQRENSLWATARKLRFTASNFGQIIAASKRNRLCASLKKRLLSAYNLQKRAPIQWWITHEKNGLDAYCRTGGVTLVQTGIWLHESGIFGASPDGFVQGDYCGRVHLQEKEQPAMSPDFIEVKCPFSAKDMTITEACHSNNDFYL